LQRDAPALEVGQGAQWRVGGHEDGRAFGLGRLRAHIQQVTARGLGKDRRRISGQAEVQAACGQGLQQLRPGRELQPADLGARKALFQHALLLEDDQVHG
jgi:hypothetical protein